MSLLPELKDAILFDLGGYFKYLPLNRQDAIAKAIGRFSFENVEKLQTLFAKSDKTAQDELDLYWLVIDFKKDVTGMFTELAWAMLKGRYFHATVDTFRTISDVDGWEVRSDIDQEGPDWGKCFHYKGNTQDKSKSRDDNDTILLSTGLFPLTPDIVDGKKQKVLAKSFKEVLHWANTVHHVVTFYGFCRVGTVRYNKERKEKEDKLFKNRVDILNDKLEAARAGVPYIQIDKDDKLSSKETGNPDHVLVSKHDDMIYASRKEYLTPLPKGIVDPDEITSKYLITPERLEELRKELK